MAPLPESPVLVMVWRELKRWVNRRGAFVTSLVTPVLWIAFFGKSFNVYGLVAGGVPAGVREVQRLLEAALIKVFGTLDYFTFFAAGMISVFVLFHSSFGSVGIIFDKRLGYMDRLLTAPVSRASIFFSRVLASVIRILLLETILLLIAIGLGMRVKQGMTPLDVLGLYATIALAAVGFSSVFNALAFNMDNHEALFATINLVNLPLMFSSNALYPISQAPWWVRGLALANPVTYTSTLTRYFLVGKGGPVDAASSLLALLLFVAVATTTGYLGFKKSLRR